MQSKKSSFFAALAMLCMPPAAALGTPIASATISETPSGGNFQYSLILQNTSAMPGTSTAIGTYWFSWVPGKDFMNTAPLSVTSAAGWQEAVTHAGAGDGYAIQWEASSSAADIAAGGSLSGFGFISSDDPATVFGNSTFYPGTSDLTAVVYEGAPFSDSGTTFVATVTPEPTTLGILGLGCVGLMARRRRAACFKEVATAGNTA